MRDRVKRTIGIFMVLIMLVLQAGCGTGEEGGIDSTVTESESNSVPKEIVVLEKTSDDVYTGKDLVTDIAWWHLTNSKLYSDSLWYGSVQTITANELSGGNVRTEELCWEDAPGEWVVEQICFGVDGSVYAYTYVRTDKTVLYYLCKFDAQGQLQYASELTEFLELVGEQWNSNWEMVSDGEGRVYLATASRIGLFAEDGSYRGEMAFDNGSVNVMDMVRAEDGKVYLAYSNNAGAGSYIAELDFGRKGVVNAAKSTKVKGLSVGIEKELLAYSEESLYEYDIAGGSMSPLFDWADCNINGSNVVEVEITTDGKFVVIISDFTSGQVSLITRMTKEEAAAVPQKQEIVIGILSNAGKSLAEAVVRFNKESDKYKVILRNYSSEAGMSAGREQLNGEIAAGKGPDILEVSNLDLYNLAKKGLFENLYDYMEQSHSELSKDDFLDRLLELYTIDEKLVAMPHEFAIQTYMGSSKLLGEEMGWNLDEVLNLIREHPEQQLLYGTEKLGMLNTLMRFNESRFINWETGECSFNSEEFVTLLELVATFSDNDSIGWGKPSLVTKLTNGEVLLANLYMNEFLDVQPYTEIFEYEYTCIGYPNEGGIGCECIPEDVMAISSQSECKEGAWEFLEYFYQYTKSSLPHFSCLKSTLEESARDSLQSDSSFKRTGTFSDGVQYTYRNPTEEEVDLIFELIDGMQLTEMDIDVFFIIKEEVAAYFEGQKSVEAVAEIIQNRVQIYVEENR